jgi:hypothetical protein
MSTWKSRLQADIMRGTSGRNFPDTKTTSRGLKDYLYRLLQAPNFRFCQYIGGDLSGIDDLGGDEKILVGPWPIQPAHITIFEIA